MLDDVVESVWWLVVGVALVAIIHYAIVACAALAQQVALLIP